ncbi:MULTISPECIES: helix-turn-helix domain-containing protein [Nocardioides]|uniref:Helix-turn-helix domain-containing protein n=1 Tax=Nocardioides vastitatis TaxID=2568655 RepID=A0ABW0ZJD0_9ACTN|nr:helix-turn-helix transcriptional regulator [Nocardioides sp.]
MRHLDRNLATPFDLAAVAEAVNVSPRTLLRQFAAETQDTPLRYLQKARVRQARHFLETTDRSISAITAAVGYGDQATFARLFQRHVGLTPSNTDGRSAECQIEKGANRVSTTFGTVGSSRGGMHPAQLASLRRFKDDYLPRRLGRRR